jgi:AAA domain
MTKTAQTPKQGFPVSLLEQAPSARLDYLKGYTVAHPALASAFNAVCNALREPAGSLLIFVFGPPGVGKTTLLAHIEKRLIEQALPILEQDRSRLPVVKLEAVAPSARQFRWPDFYNRALLSVRETLIEDKVNSDLLLPRYNEKLQRYVAPRTGVDVAELRLAWEQVLKHRRPSAVLIDEAQHLAKMARGVKLLDQLDHLKSLAVMSQTVHVLAGTYDLLVFRNLSAQLSRRSVDIHFPRYRATDKEDVRAFQSLVLAFQRHLPLEEPPDLVHQWKYLYARTIGCTGVLNDWLTKALAEALETGQKTLTQELLEHHALSVDQCNQMLSDIEEGEKALSYDADADSRLRVRLGLETPAHRRQKKKSQENDEMMQSEPSPKKQEARVGQRTPSRDLVKEEANSHAEPAL